MIAAVLRAGLFMGFCISRAAGFGTTRGGRRANARDATPSTVRPSPKIRAVLSAPYRASQKIQSATAKKQSAARRKIPPTMLHVVLRATLFAANRSAASWG